MRTGVCETQAEESAARRGIAMRRALTLEVRQERHTVRTACDRCGLLVEPRACVARAGNLARELLAIPGESAASRQHHAHEIPHAGHDVTEGVRAQSRVDTRRLRRS